MDIPLKAFLKSAASFILRNELEALVALRSVWNDF